MSEQAVQDKSNHVIHCYVRLLMAKVRVGEGGDLSLSFSRLCLSPQRQEECIATYTAELAEDTRAQVAAYSDFLQVGV